MSFASQAVAGILRNGFSNTNKKCAYCENYMCQRHHNSAPRRHTEDYKNYITLLQQCNSDIVESDAIAEDPKIILNDDININDSSTIDSKNSESSNLISDWQVVYSTKKEEKEIEWVTEKACMI